MAAGKKNHSLGRVQTPVLALVSRRYLENRDFNAVPYYRLELSVLKDGKELVFTCPEKYMQQQEAVAARNRIAASRVATVIQAERKETVEEPPLLHDLLLAEGGEPPDGADGRTDGIRPAEAV